MDEQTAEPAGQQDSPKEEMPSTLGDGEGIPPRSTGSSSALPNASLDLGLNLDAMVAGCEQAISRDIEKRVEKAVEVVRTQLEERIQNMLSNARQHAKNGLEEGLRHSLLHVEAELAGQDGSQALLFEIQSQPQTAAAAISKSVDGPPPFKFAGRPLKRWTRSIWAKKHLEYKEVAGLDDASVFEPSSTFKARMTRSDRVIYRDVFDFTSYLRAEVNIHGKELVQRLLPRRLMGRAADWYNLELNHQTHSDLEEGEIETWCHKLEQRFRDSPCSALRALENAKYTIADVRRRRNPRDCMVEIARYTRDAGIAETEYGQVLIGYAHMAAPLRLSLPYPKPNSTVFDFVEVVMKKYACWVKLYKRVPASAPGAEGHKGKPGHSSDAGVPRQGPPYSTKPPSSPPDRPLPALPQHHNQKNTNTASSPPDRPLQVLLGSKHKPSVSDTTRRLYLCGDCSREEPPSVLVPLSDSRTEPHPMITYDTWYCKTCLGNGTYFKALFPMPPKAS
ncbi:MAG: hypothetical protein M1815_005667 [Lichina confinis]|nr:MAG: hypothetical protein M1815_005667 [Lichina confinis]